jgi:ubiquinone/menaquinone biosynthesis C-methylase UbiE
MLDRLHGKPSERQTSGSMEGWGKTYDALVGILFLGQERKIRQATLDLVRIKPGEPVLEVGCGTGSLTLAAKARVGSQSQVCGIDIAPDMIATARKKAEKAGLDIQFQVGRIESIPFPDNQFGLVLSSMMIHHVHGNEAKQKGFEDIFRVLKPGGRLLIVDTEPPQNPHIRGLAGHILGQELFAHNVRELIPMLEKAGFVEIKTGPMKYNILSFLVGKRP